MGVISIVCWSRPPSGLSAVIVTRLPDGGVVGALYTAVSGPVVVMVGVLALQVTSGVSLLTSADNCTLVPAIMLRGAPSIATLGGGGVLLTSIDTVATAGASGNELFGSLAAKVKLSGPL